MTYIILQTNYDQNSDPKIFGPYDNKDSARATMELCIEKFTRERDYKVKITRYKDDRAADLYTAESWSIRKIERVPT